ncbi:MAG: tRNA dihydrouridine synthase DusB [Geobacteraceae bacterium]|nr:tRNA dihydrouridine synthase DusB [Geobacteraceae bacterium]
MKTKLKIGSLELADNLLLAPMAGITNLPMRLLAREQGASLCFTEMVSVNGLVRDGRKSFDLMRSTADDRPLGVQLFGDDPELLALGAELSAGYADLIDINMGCPVKKVVGSGAGSALLQNPEKVRAIVRRVRAATKLPFTVKIRSGWSSDSLNYLLVGRIAEDEGADALTLHPRTRAQMFEGHSDWSHLAELKKCLKIPVLGSGDLFTAGDVMAMLEQTGCDGVMIARGALGNPWIFRESLSLQCGLSPQAPSPQERFDTAFKHLQLFVSECGERIALNEMRKHLCWYARGLSGAARFRGYVNQIESRMEIEAAMREFFMQSDHES